jgi:RNA polymerase sigma-70 factor (ECF subfamily)
MTDPADLARDAALIASARAGERGSFAELLRVHRGAVFRLCRNQVGEEAEALDLTQEAFAAAFANLWAFDPTRSFRTWVLRIALNKCRDWARRRKVRRFFAFARPLDEAERVVDASPPIDDALASQQELQRLRHAIVALPSSLKDPLILCAIEEMSQAAAAEVLGITEKAIETRIYRARRRLAQMLAG